MLESTYWMRTLGRFPVYIYKLTDPRGFDLCYVGRSKNPLQRLRHHLAYPSRNERLHDWIMDLKRNGLKPVLSLLDTCEVAESNQAELDCIAAIRAIRGYACLNIQTVREKRI
jgi:hypothetical protein